MPANAVIVDARVRIKYFDIRGVDPTTTHGALVADVRTGFFGASQALAAEDFNAPASKIRLGVFRPVPNSPTWWTMLIRPADYQYVNAGGITQFRLRFELRTNGDNIEDWIRFASGNNVTATQPRMTVAYYIPHP